MALCKDSSKVKYSSHSAFDALHTPGVKAPHAGIYRCVNCGDEIAIAGGHVLPPQNHHQHTSGQPIRWQLTVFAQQQ